MIHTEEEKQSLVVLFASVTCDLVQESEIEVKTSESKCFCK